MLTSVLLTVATAYGGDLYVATSGNNTHACDSTGTACATLAGAIGKASLGDTIYVDAGTFNHTASTYPLMISGLSVVGAGKDDTLIVGTTGTSVFAADPAEGAVAVRDLGIQGGDLGVGFSGGAASSLSAALSVSNVAFDNMGAALWLQVTSMNAFDLDVKNVTAQSISGSGVYGFLGQINSADVLFQSNSFSEFETTGVDWTSSSVVNGNLQVVGNKFNNGAVGFNNYIYGTSSMANTVLFSDNTVSGNSSTGLVLQHSSVGDLNVTVANNTIVNNGHSENRPGVFVYAYSADEYAGTITNNTFSGNGEDGIQLTISASSSGSSESEVHVLFSGNLASSNDDTGAELNFWYGGMVDLDVVGNTMNSNGSDGLGVNMTSNSLGVQVDVLGNTANGNDNDGLDLYFYYGSGSQNLLVSGNIANDNGDEGIENSFSSNSYPNVVYHDNTATGNDGNGIRTYLYYNQDGAVDITLTNNLLDNNDGSGWQLETSHTQSTLAVVVSGNTFSGNNDSGAEVSLDSGIYENFRLDVAKNLFLDNEKDGFEVNFEDGDINDYDLYFSGNTFSGNSDDGLYLGLPTAIGQATVRNNYFHLGQDDQLDVEVTSGNAELWVSSNTFMGTSASFTDVDNCIDISIEVDGYFAGTFRNNDVRSCAEGLRAKKIEDGTMSLHVEDNTFADNAEEGVRIYAESSSAHVDATLIGNLVTNNAETGVALYLSDDSDFNRTLSAALMNNEITANGDGLFLGAGESGQAEVTIDNNFITDNLYDGVVAGVGMLSVGLTRNQISGNGATTSTSSTYYAIQNQAGASVDANGNWWGTEDTDDVADRIEDTGDGVEWSVWSYDLSFTPDAVVLSPDGGETVKIWADGDSPRFMDHVRDMEITVDFGDGVGTDVVVSEDGSYLEVVTPEMPTGWVDITITCPNGATGTLEEALEVVLQLEDRDEDGVGDDFDNCPEVSNADQLNTDGANDGGDACDDDDDDDTVDDGDDNCPWTFNDDQDNTDGEDDGGDACDDDDDDDGVDDVVDNCAFVANASQDDNDFDGLGDDCDDDDDNDDVDDDDDNCPWTANDDQSDLDSDDEGDVCDDDIDDDDVLNDDDNCPEDANTKQADLDLDGWGDECDVDIDGDGVDDDDDNCVEDRNSDQADHDSDDSGDVCDNDDDDDGVKDKDDNCAWDPNAGQDDADSDGLGDVCDDDDDNDDVLDATDNCPNDANSDQADADSDGIGDACDDPVTDADGDGIDDAIDNCVDVANADQADADEDAIGDACDDDSDNDDVPNADDNCPDVANADQADADDDGWGDACDTEGGTIDPSSIDTDETTGCGCATGASPMAPSGALLVGTLLMARRRL
jgi:hypothetical protein